MAHNAKVASVWGGCLHEHNDQMWCATEEGLWHAGQSQRRPKDGVFAAERDSKHGHTMQRSRVSTEESALA